MGWIDHKYQSTNKMLENWEVYGTHIESLSQTDFQATSGAELNGFLLKGVIQIVIYLYILAPNWQLNLDF